MQDYWESISFIRLCKGVLFNVEFDIGQHWPTEWGSVIE